MIDFVNCEPNKQGFDVAVLKIILDIYFGRNSGNAKQWATDIVQGLIDLPMLSEVFNDDKTLEDLNEFQKNNGINPTLGVIDADTDFALKIALRNFTFIDNKTKHVAHMKGSNQCWASCTAMLKGVDLLSVFDKTKDAPEYYFSNGGYRMGDRQARDEFKKIHGLNEVQAPGANITDLKDLLAKSSIYVDIQCDLLCTTKGRRVDCTRATGHAVVVSGLVSDNTLYGTYIKILNPWNPNDYPGVKYNIFWVSYRQFLNTYRNQQTNGAFVLYKL